MVETLPPSSDAQQLRTARKALAALQRLSTIFDIETSPAWWVVDEEWTQLLERNPAADTLFQLGPLAELADIYSQFPAAQRRALAEVAQTGGTILYCPMTQPCGQSRMTTTTAVPLPNGEVGFLTVDTTAEASVIVDLENELQELKNKLTEAEAQVHEANARLTAHQHEITRLRTALDVERQARSSSARSLSAYEQTLNRLVHDLRAPLNTILGFGELIRRNETNEERLRWLGHVDDSGRHLLDTADQLLDLARTSKRRQPLTPTKIDVAHAIADASAVVRHDIHRRNIQLELHIAPGLQGFADPRGLGHVLSNLLSNAVSHTPDHGLVRVEASKRGRRIAIEVTDSGGGVPPTLLNQIFEPYTRGEQPGKPREGFGLGLAISRENMEAMRGSIGAYNTKNRGACFWIEFPSSGPQNQGAKLVLNGVADIPFAEFIEAAISESVEVRTVRSASALVRVAQDCRPDAIVINSDLGISNLPNTVAGLRVELGAETNIVLLAPLGVKTPPGVSYRCDLPVTAAELSSALRNLH